MGGSQCNITQGTHPDAAVEDYTVYTGQGFTKAPRHILVGLLINPAVAPTLQAGLVTVGTYCNP
jgi:hypothetical protein